MIKRITFLIAGAMLLTQSAIAADDFTVAGVTFTKPGAWKKVAPKSSMRKAQFAIEDGSKSAEVVFFHFGQGGAGGVDANVKRWLSQFQKLDSNKQESKSINGTKVTYVVADGTYMLGKSFFGPKTPTPGYAMFAAIVESKQGAIFVKTTGPKKIVDGSHRDQRKMIEQALK
ncbi:MAG: hypothetical protein ACPGVU_17585 [Limisphaerales bacterium]